MAAYGQQAAPYSDPRYAPRPPSGSPMVVPGVTAPQGTFSPGTKIQVGSHRVVIQKYLSEGGFAHVYVVKMPKPVDGTDTAVLKRVAVPDKEALRGMRIEVETMKRLKGHRPIVTYIDSHASELKGGGYEVFLLMEHCNGGGLIDFMNTRLQHRLTEPEILNIFSDIAEGVACMHYLKPPLLHRDLKVENVLITMRGSTKRFKVCDFGSSAAPRAAPTTVVECRLMDEDIQKHTTLQYRSPEMIDVYRKQPMNEKCDIWALGVLLYKLCYYTTPFEDQGQLAILNASYKFPSQPMFSDRLKKLIASMLRESMSARPNIYQVLKESCAMQGREVPIHDIYSGPTATQSRQPSKTSSNDSSKHTASVGAVFSPPTQEKTHVPDIVPMRRGRPTTSQPASKTSPQKVSGARKVTEGDPFAALDTASSRKAGADELSSRFPSLDQFSLLHERGSNFEFDSSPVTSHPQQPSGLGQRVTEKLAEEAFSPPRVDSLSSHAMMKSKSATNAPKKANVTSPPPAGNTLSKVTSNSSKSDISRAQSIISNNPELRAISSQQSKYVSTGTMTADLPPEQPRVLEAANRLHKSESRSSSLPAHAHHDLGHRPSRDMEPITNARVSMIQSQGGSGRQSPPSRPSGEGLTPQLDSLNPTPRGSAPASRPRPASTNLEGSSLEFLRENEAMSRPQSRSPRPSSLKSGSGVSPGPRASNGDEAGPEASDLEFLRSMEEQDRGPDGTKSGKRSSLTSLSGSRNVLSGKFGDAFKRFEGGSASRQSSGRAPSPAKANERRDLTPIAGSEAIDGRSDDGEVEDDMESLTPEMRREMERQQLQEEERRVEAAQAAYRNRPTPGPKPQGPGVLPRASTIQNRVQNLLNEGQQTTAVHRTAEGYGKYSDAATAASKVEKQPPVIKRKPLAMSTSTAASSQMPISMPKNPSFTGPARTARSPATSPEARPPQQAKPPAPKKKPMRLNGQPMETRPSPAVRPEQPGASSTSRELLVAADLPGQPVLDMSASEKDNYMEDFAKRFPSLSSIEMVERDIGNEAGKPRR